MKLYFTPRSHFSRKVRMLLQAWRLEVELIDVGNVVATSSISAGGAQLFLELYPDRHPTNVQRYASIVLGTNEWIPGRFN